MKYNNIFLDGKEFKRVNIVKAKRLYDEGFQLAVYPINADPDSPWISLTRYDKAIMQRADFDKVDNNYRWYNCNCNEMGLYPKYYVRIENDIIMRVI